MAKIKPVSKTKRTVALKQIKPLPKKAVPGKLLPAKKLIPGPLTKAKKQVIYIDSSAFFPSESASGYSDHFQDGRYTNIDNHGLIAPLLLPVKSKIKSITVYYKNNTAEDMPVFILKKHVDHHAYSGEVEVSIDFCPPGTLPPDNYLAKYIDHFDASGLIKADYFYYISIGNTIRLNEKNVRTVRGIRLEYT